MPCRYNCHMYFASLIIHEFPNSREIVSKVCWNGWLQLFSGLTHEFSNARVISATTFEKQLIANWDGKKN